MIRLPSLGVTLVSFVVLSAVPAIPAAAAQRSAPRVSFIIPRSNVASSGPVLDDGHVVFGVATPRLHRSVCVSCGRKPFTNFHVQVYLRDYQRRPTSITVSRPRLLFEGASGAQIHLESLSGGWLVYDTDTLQNTWQLFARNVVTGRIILLDSSQMEGRHSRFSHASSDGNSVVWQSSSQIDGPAMPGFRFYTLATGRRWFVTSTATDAKYYYTSPQIAGNHLIMLKESRIRPTSQLFIENLTTREIHALTPPGQWNFEPFIVGNIVVWVHGSIALGHTHGLVVANLATGRRVALKHSSSQLSQIAAGRYVVFAPDYPTPNPEGTVQVYDVLTGQRRTIASGPDASGFVPNWTLNTGGSAALVRMDKPCSAANSVCPTYFVLISLGPV
jgi:hypothetical protein